MLAVEYIATASTYCVVDCNDLNVVCVVELWFVLWSCPKALAG